MNHNRNATARGRIVTSGATTSTIARARHATAIHAASFVNLVQTIDAIPAQRTAEEHARFMQRVRNIEAAVADLGDELAHEVAAYLGLMGSS